MASWVAVQGGAKAEIFDQLGLIEGDDDVTPGSRSAPFSFRELPDQWLVIFSEDFEWANRRRLIELSHFGLALACQFEDKVEMTSSLTAARDGVELWRVFHDNTGSTFRLDVTGTPPPMLAGLQESAFEEQRRNGGEDSSIDLVHDVVLDLGKAVCGYRADDDEAPFRALREARATARGGDPKSLSFFEKLLAPLRPKPYPER